MRRRAWGLRLWSRALGCSIIRLSGSKDGGGWGNGFQVGVMRIGD